MREHGWIDFFAWCVHFGRCLPSMAAEDIHIATPALASHITVEPVANPQQVVVSVLDPAGEPIRDLQRTISS